MKSTETRGAFGGGRAWTNGMAALALAAALALGCGSSGGGPPDGGADAGGAGGGTAAGGGQGGAKTGVGGGGGSHGGAGAAAGAGGAIAGAGGAGVSIGGHGGQTSTGGTTGGNGAVVSDAGVDARHDAGGCPSGNPDPCICGRPDANSLSATECTNERACQDAGGSWEPYFIELAEGGSYGPRCQTVDGSVLAVP